MQKIMFHWKNWEKKLSERLIITKKDEDTVLMAALSGTRAVNLRVASVEEKKTFAGGKYLHRKSKKSAEKY